MDELELELNLELGSVVIDCPECEFEFDEDHVCDICGYVGGQGEIPVLNWLKNNIDIFTKSEYTDLEEDIRSKN